MEDKSAASDNVSNNKIAQSMKWKKWTTITSNEKMTEEEEKTMFLKKIRSVKYLSHI